MKKDLQELVREDENYQRYRKILAGVKQGLDILKTSKEAGFLHSQRIVRNTVSAPKSLIY